MARSSNVATPPVTCRVVVPALNDTPRAGGPTATDTWLVSSSLTTLPYASLSCTTTAGAMTAPGPTLPGCVVKASCDGRPGVTANGAVATAGSPEEVASSW